MERNDRAMVSIWLALTLGMMAPAASAYLDPSTGSMILSAIIGIFATAALAVKTYWYKLKNFLRGKRSAESPRRDEGEQARPDEKWGQT